MTATIAYGLFMQLGALAGRFTERAIERINFYLKIQRGGLSFKSFVTGSVTMGKSFLRRLNFQEKLSAGRQIETPCLLPTFRLRKSWKKKLTESNAMHTYTQIEDSLNNNAIASAQTKVSTLNNTAVVENNYKTFYNLYLKTKNGIFGIPDSLALLNLANLCPYTEGGVVYQARALFNIVNDTYHPFADNCNMNTGNRLFDNVVKDNEQKNVNVIFKSKLYPNPTQSTFNIETENEGEKSVTVYDITGKTIYSSVTTNKLIIITDLTTIKGTYLVKIIYKDNSFDVHRLIID